MYGAGIRVCGGGIQVCGAGIRVCGGTARTCGRTRPEYRRVVFALRRMNKEAEYRSKCFEGDELISPSNSLFSHSPCLCFSRMRRPRSWKSEKLDDGNQPPVLYSAGMKVRTILLTLPAIIVFAAAYRFASHGIPLKDNFCIGLACIAVVMAVVLLWFAFLYRPRQRD